MLIPIWRHGDINLPGPNVNAGRIRFQYGPVLNGFPLPAAPFAGARVSFPFGLPLGMGCRNRRSAGFRNTLFSAGGFGLAHAEYTPAPSNGQDAHKKTLFGSESTLPVGSALLPLYGARILGPCSPTGSRHHCYSGLLPLQVAFPV